MTARRQPSPSPARIAELDPEFMLKLDLWGAYFRLCVALPGLVIALLVLPEQRVVSVALSAYVTLGALVPPMLHARIFKAHMFWIRPLLAAVDVAMVSALSYGWGTQVSPATYMFIPLVVGWTLVPQRGVGLFALALSLLSLLAILLLEHREVIPTAPLAPGVVNTAPGGAVLFYCLVTSAFTAAHFLVVFVVRRMAEHVLALGTLRAEHQAREREAAWASELEETQRLEALGRLAGGVAHDFNNLLTALIGFAEIAQRKLHTDARMAESALKELGHAAERASDLTGQLLDFASRRATQPKSVDLRDEVQKAAKLLARVLHADIALQVSLCEMPCVVNLDPSGLERVLVNLGVNARDAMPTGGVLHIGLSIEGDWAELDVSDTGTGIDPADLPRIFEPFFTTKERGRGAGLGLASVYGVVKQAGGEIDVLSKPGAGTTFSVRFPLAQHVEDAADLKPRGPQLGTGTVLLVDDQLEVRTVTRAHLEAAGYAVVEAESAHQALVLSSTREITALVSDVAMPGMSGLELSHALRTRLPDLPILLISGYSDADLGKRDTLPVGARFLAKPFTAERLERELALALGVV